MAFLSFTVLLFAVWRLRARLMYPSSFFAILNLGSLFVFNLYCGGIIFGDLGHFYAIQDYSKVFTRVNLVFLLMGVFALFLDYKASVFLENKSEVAVKAVWGKMLSVKSVSYFALVLGFLSFLVAIIHFMEADLSGIWQYNRYLEIRSSEFLGIFTPIGRIIHQNYLNVFLISALAISIAVHNNAFVVLLLSIFPFMYFLMIAAAQHSRAAVVAFVLIGGVLFMKGTRFILVGLFFLLIAFFLYLVALETRTEGSQYNGSYGLERVLDIAGGEIDWSSYSFGGSMKKIIFNFSVAPFNLAYYLKSGAPEQANLEYAIKSFSPFPSFLDGFSSLRSRYQLRHTAYAPFSSIVEAISFGIPYLLFYVLAVFFAFWLCFRVFFEDKILGFFCSAPLYLAIFYQTSYPVRHTFKYVVLSSLLCWLVLFLLRRFRVDDLGNLGESGLGES